MQFDWHALVPGKNWRVHFRHRGWGRQRYLPPRLHGDMATPTTIALDSSFNLLLISIILVDSDGNCQHHVIIGIAPSWSPHSGVDVNNTHLSMINPLNTILHKTLLWLMQNSEFTRNSTYLLRMNWTCYSITALHPDNPMKTSYYSVLCGNKKHTCEYIDYGLMLHFNDIVCYLWPNWHNKFIWEAIMEC